MVASDLPRGLRHIQNAQMGFKGTQGVKETQSTELRYSHYYSNCYDYVFHEVIWVVLQYDIEHKEMAESAIKEPISWDRKVLQRTQTPLSFPQTLY